jgi:hypothetical protein
VTLRAVASRALALAVAVLPTGCDGGSPPGAGPPAAPSTSSPPAPTPVPDHACAKYPPPFEATYLPDGFHERLRRGAGLFKGTDYPTRGLVGHYLGPAEGIHVNFQMRPGPLPYEPGAPRPLRVLGRRGAIGTIEGGWSVEFELGDCDFRMDSYGITRSETVKVARGLRAARR